MLFVSPPFLFEKKKKIAKRIVGRYGRNLIKGRNSFNGYNSKSTHKSTEVVLTKFMLMERDLCGSFFEYSHLVWSEVVHNGEGPLWNGEDIFMSLVANHVYGKERVHANGKQPQQQPSGTEPNNDVLGNSLSGKASSITTEDRSASSRTNKQRKPSSSSSSSVRRTSTEPLPFNNYAMDWIDVWQADDSLKDYDNGKYDISGGMEGIRFWDWRWWQTLLRRNRHYSYRGKLWQLARARLRELSATTATASATTSTMAADATRAGGT